MLVGLYMWYSLYVLKIIKFIYIQIMTTNISIDLIILIVCGKWTLNMHSTKFGFNTGQKVT